MGNRFWLYFYSTPNLVAMGLALLGLCAFFLGMIRAYWPFIVGGLYLIGYLGTPRRPLEIERLDSELELEALIAAFDRFLNQVKRRLSEPINARLAQFQETAIAILKRLDRVDGLSDTSHVVRQTVTSYLPGMIHDYLELPAAFARFQVVRAGKTARDILVEHLDGLNQEFNTILADIHAQQIDKLEAHGAFLKQRFGRSENLFALPGSGLRQ